MWYLGGDRRRRRSKWAEEWGGFAAEVVAERGEVVAGGSAKGLKLRVLFTTKISCEVRYPKISILSTKIEGNLHGVIFNSGH